MTGRNNRHSALAGLVALTLERLVRSGYTWTGRKQMQAIYCMAIKDYVYCVIVEHVCHINEFNCVSVGIFSVALSDAT